MVLQVASRRARFCARIAGLACLVFGFLIGAADAADREAAGVKWPSQVKAHYSITFNGFDIGDFRLKSKVDGGRYSIDGDAKLSALLGVFTWRGITRSSGRLDGDTPQPEGYVFNFKSSDKVGMIGMSFGDKGGVKSVSMVPQIPAKSGEVPLKPAHLKGVFDPLSAVIAMARGVKGNPCGATIPVFDGKQRFDLKLSYRRKEVLPLWQTGGRHVRLHVCGVSYRPIAGYAQDQAIQSMANSTAIEVTMRALPGGGIYIPHQISIPTIAGPVVLAAKKIDVLPAGSRKVAQAR